MSTATKSPVDEARAELEQAHADLLAANEAAAEMDRSMAAGENVSVDDYASITQRVHWAHKQLKGKEAKLAKADVENRIATAQKLRAEVTEATPVLAERITEAYAAVVRAMQKLVDSCSTHSNQIETAHAGAYDLHMLHPEDEPRALRAAVSQVTHGLEPVSPFGLGISALIESVDKVRLTENERAAIHGLSNMKPSPAYTKRRAEEQAVKAAKPNE